MTNTGLPESGFGGNKEEKAYCKILILQYAFLCCRVGRNADFVENLTINIKFQEQRRMAAGILPPEPCKFSAFFPHGITVLSGVRRCIPPAVSSVPAVPEAQPTKSSGNAGSASGKKTFEFSARNCGAAEPAQRRFLNSRGGQ